ncbi:hypothetical protein GOV12_06250, partial [Candidatus Pacearchaeota archaeon]|nr:hypothetical protein [Candidatus Pacearchaeota archaeon]
NPENKKDLFQEIKIGYNEEFGIRKVPFLSRLPFQSITLPEGFERLRDGSPVVIRDPGKISSVSLYLLGNCEFNLFWYYPVLDDHNQVFMHFKREKIYHIMGEIFRDGHLSQPRELTRDDPKKLCEILDNLEPWLLDLIKFQ